MAERDALQKQYAYHAMSNKVEQASRSRRSRGEPTGEVESLRGRQDVGRMGDRVEEQKPLKKKLKQTHDTEPINKHKKEKISSRLTTDATTSILNVNVHAYQPTTPSAKAAYNELLTMIGSRAFLSNQDTSILIDAAELILETLKDDSLRDPERQVNISNILLYGKKHSLLSKEHYAQFVQLAKRIDDYHAKNINYAEEKDEQLDDEGVAVVFDESEAEDDNDSEGLVAAVLDSEEDETDEESEEEGPSPNSGLVDHDEERLGEKKLKATTTSADQVRTLTVHEIDAHYVQRQLSQGGFSDANQVAELSKEVLQVLGDSTDLRECENKLLVLMGIDLFSIMKLFLHNRRKLWAVISMKKALTQAEKTALELELQNDAEGRAIWAEMISSSQVEDWSRERMKGITDTLKKKDIISSELDAIGVNGDRSDKEMQLLDEPTKAIELDLEALVFRDGAHTMSNTKCNLPSKSWRAMKKGYEEVHVPAVRSVVPKDEVLVPITQLPDWTHAAFTGMEKLNRVQSKMYPIALETSENLLLCAPTGAGKTNVAMLTMLNILGRYRRESPPDDETKDVSVGSFDLTKFKIVYVAPMKALVQEVVKNFSSRLKEFGVVVRELSGDSSLTRQQIADTQLLVTTPEKWDIVTRQGEGRAYTQLVKLVIIDEIHLLHDDRGPVLESIVARVIRQVETTAEPIRLVGLSATLPNYADVATFLRVKPDKGLFFFDHSFRPVPLQMQYVGITERNAFKRFQLQNDICYDRALTQRRHDNQMLIFVHSRAETGKTAKALRDMALERDELSHFVREGGATQEILREEALLIKNADLKDVLPYGFAIHHAGMGREDRELVEDLFADRHIAVLCTTATLAWGVNLPAHAVIIKGTQIYDPARGKWAELSPLDILQMLGRAGRPQYDVEGEGIIITQHSELQYYLSLTNLQLPVESQLIRTLPDHINAEVVLGTVQSLDDAVDWLSYTFLYVRMLQNPSLYGIHDEAFLKNDPTLKKRRIDLAHTAASVLEKSLLVQYDRRSGSLRSTALGRVASQYYISHSSMAVYSRHMRPHMTDIELLRLFALSEEFNHITVREEEKLELAKLVGKVPIPVKESPSDPSAKVNMLLQAYISKLKLDGFALVADMAFVQQSAARIMRALFEIALRRNWAGLAKLTLAFSNMVSHRIWRSQTPLRQFSAVPEVVARKLESKSDIEWDRFADLSPSDLGELVGVPKMGKILHGLVHKFPRLDVSAVIQPITRSMLRIELTLVSAFEFDIDVHGFSQLFHVIVEDVNGETILYHQTFTLKRTNDEDEHVLVITVPVVDPLPPAYFIRVISDRWLHSEAVLPISLSNTILPAKFPPPTELLDLQPLPVTTLNEPAFVKLFPFKDFNPVQTQTFHELFKTSRNVLVCAPSGSGKTTLIDFAILRLLLTEPEGKCVYVAPIDEVADHAYTDWSRRFGELMSSSQIVRLTGEAAADMSMITNAKVIVATANQWDSLSRRWKQRKALHSVALLIFDELHLLGGKYGPTLEVVISRMRYLSSASKEKPLRIVGLGASIANAREVGEWMGVTEKSLFNFSPKVRPTPLEIYFQSFDQSNYASRLMAMSKPVYNAVVRHGEDKSVMVFVPSRKQAQLTAIDLMTYHESQLGRTFLGEIGNKDLCTKKCELIRDESLRHVSLAGIGFLYEGMRQADLAIVLELYTQGHIRALICPSEVSWKIMERAHLVVIMGTEYYDGKERRHVDYDVGTLLRMMGRASRHNDEGGKCVLLCHSPKKEYLKKLLYDPLPIESHLDHYFHDHFNSEIVTRTISSLQDAVDYITWTFLYRRLSKNPNYYSLQGTSNIHVSEHLSDMVESVLGNLSESKCCQLDEDGNVFPLNLGMVAAYYYVQYTTIELIASSVTGKTKIRGIMEILANASEFSSIPVRSGEEKILKMEARTLRHKLPENMQFNEWSTKTLVLLQAHFSRKILSSEFLSDQAMILTKSITIVQAIVDVISSYGWLKPALAAMELSQMIVQGLWNRDSALKQIPHFTDEIISRLRAYQGEEPIDSVFDILNLDDDVRNELLKLNDAQMADVAVFCNTYPNIDVTFEVNDATEIIAGEPVIMRINLARDVDEEEELAVLGMVSSAHFPGRKKEGWWVVIGDTSTNGLLSLKRIVLQQKINVQVEFMAPEEPGDYDLTLFCMSDCYMGCDQEYSVKISVAPGNPDDEDNDTSEEDSR